jgi:hypothetical protein
MLISEFDERHDRVRSDLAALDNLIDEAYYSWRNALLHPWRTFKKQREVDAELARLHDEFDALLSADIEFPTI